MFIENYQSLVPLCWHGFGTGIVWLSRGLSLLSCGWWGHWRDLGRGLGVSWASRVELDTDRLSARELSALDLQKFPHGPGRD